MAVKTLQQLQSDIEAQRIKVDEGSITPDDVFGIDRDIVDSLDDKLTLSGSTDGNITVDQSNKRINLAQVLKNITSIQGVAGGTNINVFCDADYQRDPELFISKALLALRALEIRLKTNNIDRLVLNSTGVSLNAAGGNSILYATANEINIFDATSGNPLITRNNDGNLSLFFKKNGSISPLLSTQSGSVTLYSNNANRAPMLATTETTATIYNHNGNPVMQSTTTANGISFAILRDNLKPFANYDPATNTFTIYGNNKTGGVRKLVEQISDTSCSYYGITDTEIFRHERNGEVTGFQVNNSFAKAVYNSVVFKGTTAAWNALTASDKDKYESVILID